MSNSRSLARDLAPSCRVWCSETLTVEEWVRRRLLPAVSLAVMATTVLACTDPVGQCVCTEEFRAYPVTVVDVADQPVADVVLTRTHIPTGAVLEPTWLGMPAPGVYIVADDGLIDVFSSDGDVVQVTGQKGAASFQVDFVFAVPDPCRCHVEQRAGPDTVVIR